MIILKADLQDKPVKDRQKKYADIYMWSFNKKQTTTNLQLFVKIKPYHAGLLLDSPCLTSAYGKAPIVKKLGTGYDRLRS